MKIGHSVWAKYREGSDVIDLQALFNDYWNSSNHEFTVQSQPLSPASPGLSDREEQRLLSLESIVALWNYDSLQVLPLVHSPLPIPARE